MKEENYKIIFSLEKDNWWYQSKRNLLFAILRTLNRKFQLALDIGCGVGSNSGILERFAGKTVGIDCSERALDYCRGKYSKLYKMSAENLEFKDNSFDMILCSDVLEHLDSRKALKEIERVLKPSGILIFSVPAHKYLWGPTDRMSNHKTRYEKHELRQLLRGFIVIKLSYWNCFMYLPNLLFIKLLSKKYKPQNTLQIIPKYLNKLLYLFLSLENKLFLNLGLPQGVSIVGICQKR